MENPASAEIYRNFVERIFVIEDVTMGSQKDGFLTRYRGHLRLDDSEQAYFQLAEQLKPFNITPLFRKEKDKQVVLLVEGVADPKESNPWVNLVLFILTLMSVLLTGAMYGMKDPFSGDIFHIVISIFQNGWPFGVSMLAILGTHEFGHYLMGRHHGVHVTLPYFIPLPFSPFGTMGAFINMKEPPKNRRQLLDIGLAGPLAGLIVAIPVLFIGLKLSTIDLLPFASVPGQMLQLEGNSLLYLFMKFLAFGKLLPSPTSFNGLNPVLYWIGYFFTGQPYPLGGTDVLLHQVAWAGWAGMLVTALNLIPAGQLDGGHVIYVLLGKEKAKRLRPFILIFLILMGFVWNGWWLWAAIIFFLGRAYAEPLDQITELDYKRKVMAVVALVVFIMVFTPVPLILIG